MSYLKKIQSIKNSNKALIILFIITAIALVALAIGALTTYQPLEQKDKQAISSSSNSNSEAVVFPLNPDFSEQGRRLYYEFCLIQSSETPDQRQTRLAKITAKDIVVPESYVPEEVKTRDCSFYEDGSKIVNTLENDTLLQIHAKQHTQYHNGSNQSKEVFVHLELTRATDGTPLVKSITYKKK